MIKMVVVGATGAGVAMMHMEEGDQPLDVATGNLEA